MKLLNNFKLFAVLALVVGIATGCAGKPTENEVVPDAAMEQARAAIVEARAAYSKVDQNHYDYGNIGRMIADAEAALAVGDSGRAIQLANQAKQRAEAAAREGVAKVEAEPAKATSYTVARGDSLWAISGKSGIYGNPYQWPLIYKANRDKIKDADLIYPGQNLQINRAASQADIDAAVKHARTRGAWSLGVTEASDLRYLSR